MRIVLSTAVLGLLISPVSLLAADKFSEGETEAVKKVADVLREHVGKAANEAEVLNQILVGMDDIGSKIGPDFSRDVFIQNLKEQTKSFFSELKNEKDWKDAQNDILDLPEILDLVDEDADKSGEYRKTLRRIFVAAANVELFRRNGMGDEDQSFSTLLLDDVLDAEEIVVDPKDKKSKKVDGPGLDQEPDRTLKALAGLFKQTDETLDKSDDITDFEALIDARTNKVFDDLKLSKDDRPRWEAARDRLELELRRRSGGDADEYRRLLRGPVKRSLQMAIFDVDAMLTAEGPQVLASGNDSNSGANNTTPSRTSSERRRRSGPCCLRLLFGTSP